MADPALHWCIRKCLLGANFAAPAALLATRFHNPWIVGAATLAHTAFASAIVRPGCGWFGPVVTRFEPRGKEVWLTIDDGPAGATTETLSAALAGRGARATFFVKGRNLTADPSIARRLMDAGHTLANHTDTHPCALFWGLWKASLAREIDACNTALREAGVAETRWFRAPVGLKNVRLHPLLAERGMRLIAWSVRSGDGIDCDPAVVSRRVAARVRPGAILLLHEGRPRSNEAILRVVEELQARGFTLVIPSDEQLA